MEPLAYLNGQLMPASQAKIAVFDAAVVMGATVTDLLRTFRHEPFRLDDHVRRFYRSCRYARISPPVSIDQTSAIIRELIQHNSTLISAEHDLAVVCFISPGEFSSYAGSAGGNSKMTPTYCIHTFPLPFQLWADHYRSGAHVVTPSTRHVPPQCVDPKIKHRSRLHFWLAEQEAHLIDPKAIPLLLDLDGNVTETAGSNFVIVKNDAVISPSPRHILRGVSLATVFDLCKKLGIEFHERDLQVYDVINADEACLTSTPYCLAPVTRINGLPIGSGTPGPVFKRLVQAWSELVGMDIVEQITTVHYPEQ